MSSAAHHLTDPQQILQSLVALLQEEAVEQAAKLYSRLSEDVGYYLVQKLPDSEQKLRMRLAKMFFLAKDFEKAALVFEQAGEFAKAAKLYEKADDYGMAAEMHAKVEAWPAAAMNYEKNGNFATAAELFQKIGDLNRAAANFEQAVNHFRAGKTYYQLGKYDKAVDLLQKIGPEDPSYVEATLMVNQVLAQGGYRTIAIRKLSTLLDERGLDEETLDIGLALAENLYAEGDLDDAKDWVSKVLEIRIPYKHAGELLQKIESGEVVTEEVVEEAVVVGAADGAAEEPSDELEILEDLEPMEDTGPITALEEDFDSIRDASLFQELNLQELKTFWNLVEPNEYADGDVVIEQDAPGTGLYIVSEGHVNVVRVGGDGGEEQLAHLGPGSHLGEMSLLDESPTSARVKAAGACKVYRMPKDSFQQLIDSNDRLARKIYQAFAATLMDRLRETNEKFKTFKSNQQKEMADLFGIKE